MWTALGHRLGSYVSSSDALPYRLRHAIQRSLANYICKSTRNIYPSILTCLPKAHMHTHAHTHTRGYLGKCILFIKWSLNVYCGQSPVQGSTLSALTKTSPRKARPDAGTYAQFYNQARCTSSPQTQVRDVCFPLPIPT
ncbi:hypothetical protein mRhiFer1_009023 [Rhinolophus ferrumequinum]|uniref:Uncharacterized protein n=1 Tax=Rhinolophus ferrumequinum TaxID=59479 RepID=A0A7J7SXC0_RHIFE|nr:hypothetical protein mRhiFer1_009023 [Rhinolophus ferrumequinum]